MVGFSRRRRRSCCPRRRCSGARRRLRSAAQPLPDRLPDGVRHNEARRRRRASGRRQRRAAVVQLVHASRRLDRRRHPSDAGAGSFASTAPPRSSSRGWPSAGRGPTTAAVYTLTLRDGLTFSDGQPAHRRRCAVFVSSGVRPGGRERDGGRPDGRRPAARGDVDGRRDRHHHLRQAFRARPAAARQPADSAEARARAGAGRAASSRGAGASARRWTASSGSGPFVLVEYVPGQRLSFARNPHYFRKDANGTPLPYLDRIVIEIVPEQTAQVLRLEAGQLDTTISEVRPEDFAPLKRAADAGRVQLLDLGVGLRPGELLDQPQARRVCRRSACGVAPARRAAPGDLARRRSQGLQRRGVPRSRCAGVRSGHVGEQEVVRPRTCRGRRTIPSARRAAAGVDRPRRQKRRRPGRGRAGPGRRASRS